MALVHCGVKRLALSVSWGRCQQHQRRVFCQAQQLVRKELREARLENVPGDFFVDHTCIDCDTCRFMSKTVFRRVGEQSAVYKQPENAEERFASLQALLSCPTYSIHVKQTEKGELRAVQKSFPIPVPSVEGVYFCGFTDEIAYAASAYFIKSPCGNVLIDSPRYNPVLVKGFDALGGIDIIFLTHMDDVGDHAKWAQHYGAPRILHKKDIQPDTQDCEMLLEGEGPWTVGPRTDLNEMEIIFTPGHTPGSICLFHKPSQSMFTGDHFLYSEKNSGFSMLEEYNKDDPSLQLKSVEKLMDYPFLNLIPGHQRRFHFSSVAEKDTILKEFISTYPTLN